MTKLYDPDLTQWLQNSGEYIGRVRPAEERAAWILFLLDEVEAFLPADECASLLSEIDHGIQTRLDALGEDHPTRRL